ncbi:MAG: tRNA pseudouridine(55) synthase TruB [Bacteroidia bacterium]
MKSFDFRVGEVLVIDKPLTWTSFQVVNKIKYIIKTWERNSVKVGSQESALGNQKSEAGILNSQTQTQTSDFGLQTTNYKLKTKIPNLKIGHAGTLDPLATGVLIICTGKQTKNIAQYQAQEKEYTGTFYIGATTPCYDLEHPIDKHYPTAHITNELIYETAKKFTGKIQQTPPLFSAIKIDGQRAYDIARAGQTAEIKSREITIHEFEITRIALPEVDFRVVCSKGTYIRSLVRDFAEAVGSGGHLIALRRTRIGQFSVSNALTIEGFEAQLLK